MIPAVYDRINGLSSYGNITYYGKIGKFKGKRFRLIMNQINELEAIVFLLPQNSGLENVPFEIRSELKMEIESDLKIRLGLFNVQVRYLPPIKFPLVYWGVSSLN